MNRSTKDKQQIEQWCEALESGKYQQIKYFLQDEKGYCCLGVACELFGENLVKNEHNKLKGSTPFDQESRGAKLPDWLLEINTSYAFVLSYMNDVEKMSFKEIAKVIREEVLQ